MQLPDLLRPHEAALVRALAASPVMADWPEGEGYLVAESPEAVAAVLIPILHDHLRRPSVARIAYLFRETIKNAAGKAGKAGAKLTYLADLDFTIEFNWTSWRSLTAEQRVALVDHELAHCAWDGEKERWALREHDIEEFRDIVQRWGLWHPALERFGKDVIAAQTDLFAVPAP